MSGIWVVIEERDGRVSRGSLEALAAGQKLAALVGQPANAAVIGAHTESLATEVATKVYLFEEGAIWLMLKSQKKS